VTDDLASLARGITDPVAPGVRYVSGVVAAVNPLTVTVSASTAVPAVSLCGSLAVGMVVGCVWDGPVLTVVGHVNSKPAWTTTRAVVAGITQGTGIFPGFTTSRDMYRYNGSQVEWKFHYTGNGSPAGTSGQPLQLNLPVANALNAQPTDVDGLVLIYNPGGSGVRYNTMPERGPDAFTVYFGADGGTGDVFGTNPSVSFTTNWQIRGTIRYEWEV
jgi:hypothetical protein